MQYTSNYSLKKPEGSDIVNIDDLNHNADILDQKLKEVENKANNAPPNSVNDAAIGSRTPDQSQVPASPGTGTLTQLISWLANRIKAITGKTNWWDAPPTTLQAVKTHMDTAVHQGEVHGFRLIDGKLKFFDGSNWVEIEAAGGGVPIGSIIPWTTTTVPDGWLECNGQAVSRTGFSELFAKIGTTFGAGNGSTTFNVPDLRGEFIRGWDHGRGADSGRAFGSWQADIFKAHNHVTDSRFNKLSARASDVDNEGTARAFDADTPEIEYRIGFMNDSLWASATIKTEGGPETRPRNVALMFIIKAKNVAGSDPAVQGANADTLDGFHASAFALSGHSHPEYALTPSNIKPALNASGDAPVYACRAWVNFGYVNRAITVRASGNVSSVVRNEKGVYTVNFAIAMPDANYTPVLSVANTASAGIQTGRVLASSSEGPAVNKTTTSCKILTGTNGTYHDVQEIYVAIFR